MFPLPARFEQHRDRERKVEQLAQQNKPPHTFVMAVAGVVELGHATRGNKIFCDLRVEVQRGAARRHEIRFHRALGQGPHRLKKAARGSSERSVTVDVEHFDGHGSWGRAAFRIWGRRRAARLSLGYRCVRAFDRTGIGGCRADPDGEPAPTHSTRKYRQCAGTSIHLCR